MSQKEFEEIVANAIDHIPSPYQEKLGEINFIVEDEPTPEQRAKLGLRSCDALFGLYEGVPLTNRNGMVYAKVPDVITVFMHPMVELFPSAALLKKQIYETVWHEVAHFYGLNHDRIHKIKNGLPR